MQPSQAGKLQVADYCASIGLPRVPPTLGAISVAFIKSGDTRLLASVLGRKTSANGAMGKEALPELAAHQALMADAFHGGWNECHSVGLYGPEDSAGRDSTDSFAGTGRPYEWRQTTKSDWSGEYKYDNHYGLYAPSGDAVGSAHLYPDGRWRWQIYKIGGWVDQYACLV